MMRLGWNRARGLLASELQRLFQLSYGSLLRLDSFTGEALTGLEAGRSVSGVFLLPGEALAGLEAGRSEALGWKIRLGDSLTGLEAGRSVSDLGI